MTLEDARDMLATAACLGEPVPAIPGTVVWVAWTYSEYGQNTTLVGIYPAYEAAVRALAGLTLQDLTDTHESFEYGPWSSTDAWKHRDSDEPVVVEKIVNDWLATHTDAELLDSVYANDDEVGYAIERVAIESATIEPLRVAPTLG